MSLTVPFRADDALYAMPFPPALRRHKPDAWAFFQIQRSRRRNLSNVETLRPGSCGTFGRLPVPLN
jgi:hypothetical protein